MATNLTFTSLQGDIRKYLERGFTADTDPLVYEQLPRLINNSERKIARALKILGFQEAFTATMTVGATGAVIAKPDRWRKTISFNFGNGATFARRTFIYSRTYEYLRMYWPDGTVLGTPKFYADYKYTHWLVAPSPDRAYPFEIMCYQLPPLLDDTTQTNWTTEFLPDALLYCALVESEPYIKDDKRIATWKGMYDEAMAAIKAEDMARIFDRTSMRSGT